MEKIGDWVNYEKEPLLIVKRLREHFTDPQIETILGIVTSTCRHCWDYENKPEDVDYCQCANDE